MSAPQLIQLLTSGRLLSVLALGFASGLPLALTGSTLQAWMTEAGVDIKVIGIFALVALPYSLKPFWAPFLDRYSLPGMDRRRGWALVCLLGMSAAVAVMSGINPQGDLWSLALAAIAVAFFSASFDIVVDAYRAEVLSRDEYGLGASVHIFGYRMAMLTSGALALFLAEHFPWPTVYRFAAAVLTLLNLVVLLAPAPQTQRPPRTLAAAFWEPLGELLQRPNVLAIAAFIVLYKLGDALAASLMTTFLLDIGFSKSEIAAIAKTVGLGATLFGALAGGSLMLSLGLMRSLWLFGVLQAVSNLCFAALAQAGHSPQLYFVAVIVENVCGGMGTAAYTAFLMSLCNQRYTATQYALFTSLMALTRTLATTPSGYMAESAGWVGFYLISTLAAAPGLLSLAWLTRHGDKGKLGPQTGSETAAKYSKM